uniref:Transthyretin-like family protein n=1 Tax=Rhabditophanes sp. KR3021 TaxID=114890 RepID=A0AC35U501_9BILA
MKPIGIILFLACVVGLAITSQECVWATGKIVCKHNQTRVIGSVVELWDEDAVGPLQFIDPDDKIAFEQISDEDGVFKIAGCASDTDWIPGLKNKPDMYLRVLHNCNSDIGRDMIIIKPPFKVFVPKTYDYHISHPIYLD